MGSPRKIRVASRVVGQGRRSTTRDAVAADMAVGSNIWETWNRISYQVFEAIVRDDARLAQHDASFQPNNTWLCVPQLIANLACLTSVAAASNGPGEPLRRELMNESAEAGSAASKMITFKSGIFESESVFTMSGSPDVS
ncbi:hypothetical protein TELCIR_09309 [Teladorsagia circumcincta]|uniref:Uncharacterized protein n=1 Tax=Teladorsagia circumcincta TaxID=45464 RepID=A0A2G9UF64_TELCI|nr:hypothetical protein TELCIR_09309 [Teladorsagia circumcincta]